MTPTPRHVRSLCYIDNDRLDSIQLILDDGTKVPCTVDSINAFPWEESYNLHTTISEIIRHFCLRGASPRWFR